MVRGLSLAGRRRLAAGTLPTGQTSLRVVVCQYDGNGDNRTSGDIHLWGACRQQGNDPQKGYAVLRDGNVVYGGSARALSIDGSAQDSTA